MESDSESDLRMNMATKKVKTKPFVYVLTMLSAVGGFLFGYDTGVVSGAMLLIQDQFTLSDVWYEAIVSVTIAAAWVFSLVGGLLNERFGRKPVIVLASFVFTCGAVVMGVSPTKQVLLVGRIIVGIGIGLTSMTVPMYIAEVSTPDIRGGLVTLNCVLITGGQFVASLICGAFSSDKKNGWRYMFALSGIPALIQFVGFLGMPESPRWLIKKGRHNSALAVLKSIRGPEADVETEAEAIRNSCEESDAESKSTVLWEILWTPSVRRALILGCGLQMFQQLAGINTVMYYSAMIMQMAGISDATTAIWLASVTAALNFAFTFVGLYLVEKIGRRPLILGSLTGVIVSLVLLAVGFQVATIYAPSVDYPETAMVASAGCLKYGSCGACSNNPDCGFCYEDVSGTYLNGSCVDVAADDDSSAAFGRCSNMTSGGDGTLEWAVGYCPSKYQWMPIIGLCLYVMFFAPGMGPMPWTINSEIYPLWARGTCYAIATSFNWLFNLLVSMTFLSLTAAITKYGAFYFYAGLALLGLLFVFLMLPETKGKSLEEVEGLFAMPTFSRFCVRQTHSEHPSVDSRTIQKE